MSLAACSAIAAPYNGETFTYRQPDGETFQIRLWGDEFFAYQETEDGHLVVRDDKTGEICYAKVTANGSDIVSTGVRVGKSKPAGLKPKERLTPAAAMEKSRTRRDLAGVDEKGQLKPELYKKFFRGKRLAPDKKTKPSSTASVIQQDAPATDGVLQFAPGNETQTLDKTVQYAPPSSTTTGKRVGLLLLASFPDRQGDVNKTPAQLDSYCNSTNYTADGNAISIYSYFLIQSNGKLEYRTIVTAWFVAAHNRDYYTDETQPNGARAKELLNEGLNALNNLGFDFSQCDGDGNGAIDGVNCFYAGNNVNTWSEGLWPQSGSSSWSGFTAHGLSTSYKFQITNLPVSLGTGTYIHENGHMICNFPDLYPAWSGDANMGTFSPMSAYDEKHPVSFDPYLKIAAGWADVVDLNSNSHKRCSVQADRNHFYRYRNPSRSTEYFLFEVRNNTGYEGPYGAAAACNPTAGLAAYHALQEGNNTASSIITTNNPNFNYTTPYELMVVEASPPITTTPWYGDPTPNASDGFKSTGVSQISDITVPELKFWAANGRTISSLADIHSISAAGETMSFVIGSGTVSNATELGVTANSLANSTHAGLNAASQSFSIFNTGTGTFSYVVSTNASWLSVAPASGTVSNNIDKLTVTYATSSLAAGIYNAQITVNAGAVINSPKVISVTLEIMPALTAPTITLQPSGTHLLGDANYTLTAGASACFPAPQYQWYRNGVAILGAASTNLTLAGATSADTGSYTFAAVNLAGSATSTAAVVTINDHPNITKLTPTETYVTIPESNGVVLQVSANDDGFGGSSLTHTWSAQSTPVGGSVTWDNTTTTNTAASFSTNGAYQLRFTSSDGVNTRYVDYNVSAGASPGWLGTTNHIVQYDFTETSGTTAVDAAGGNQNGTLIGGASFSNGKLVLDGTTGYLSIPSGSEIDTAGPYAKRTVALWFKPDLLNGYQTLYEEGGTNAGMHIFFNSSTKYLIYRLWSQNAAVNNFATAAYYMGPQLATGVWNHIAVVLDATTTGTALQAGAFRLYLNDVLVKSDNGVRIDSHPDGIGIGGVNGTSRSTSTTVISNTNYFDGEIKNFSLYNRALTVSEIATVMEMSNLGPIVNAGADLAGIAGFPATLDASVSDEGLPQPPASITTAWSLSSGPGGGTFENAGLTNTTFTADAVGSYVLRLSANDGNIMTFDQTTYTSSNNPGPGQLRFESGSYSVIENAGTMQLGVMRPAYGGINGAVSVSYSVTGGTAANGSDYALSSGTLNWADQDSESKTITVDITDDLLIETAETFTVSLSAPTGGATIVSPSATTVTITDNEIPDIILLQDNFNTANSADPNSNLVTRQSGTMATSGYTKETGTTASIDSNKLKTVSASLNVNNADFKSALTTTGIASFSLSFDLANTGTDWVASYLSTHTGADDRAGSRFGMHLLKNGNSTALTAYGDSGTNQSNHSVSKVTLDSLLGTAFAANQSHTFTFVANPTNSTAGSYDLFIDGIEVLSNIPYRLGTGGSNGKINWEHRNITLGIGLFDNLVIRRTMNSAPAWNISPFAATSATADVIYSTSIAASATDVDGDPVTYAKVAGPAWLSVAPDGTLSGTPSDANVGLNSFTVSASDGNGGNTTATLNITVRIGGFTAIGSVPYAWMSIWTNEYEASVTNDWDADGFTTVQEYWSGTDPRDSNSYFLIDSIAYNGSNVVLEWRHAYVDPAIPPICIQSRASLVTGEWLYADQKDPVSGTNSWQRLLPQNDYFRLCVTNMP